MTMADGGWWVVRWSIREDDTFADRAIAMSLYSNQRQRHTPNLSGAVDGVEQSAGLDVGWR